jgi:ribose transport system substrate-binding protein
MNRRVDRFMSRSRKSAVALVATVLLCAACTSGAEDEGGATGDGFSSGEATSAELLEHSQSSVEGRTLAWVPVVLGYPITDEWTAIMDDMATAMGMEFVVRDPNFDTQQMVSNVQSFVNQLSSGDVLVVHNLDVNLLANLIEQAQDKGIYVIQLNLASNYKSDAYVGADFQEVGTMAGQEIVDTCGNGKSSGKVQIINISTTDEASVQTAAAMKELFEENGLEVVSEGSALSDPTKAHDMTATVLQANPDLCAIWSVDSTAGAGAAEAVRSAGKLGTTHVYVADSTSVVCENVGNGLFAAAFGYSVPEQAVQVVTMASYLMQSGLEAGSTATGIYSRVFKVDKSNYDLPGTCYSGKGFEG